MAKFNPILIALPLLIGGGVWLWSKKSKAAEGEGGKEEAPPPPTSPPTPPTVTTPPADIGKYVLQAVASGDPDFMRQAASALEAWGYKAQADDLRRTADEEEKQEKVNAAATKVTDVVLKEKTPGIAETTSPTTVLTTLPSGISVPAPSPPAGVEQVKLPPVVPVAQPGRTIADPMDVARANLAQRTADMLRGAVKYKEDRPLVGAFQTQEITQGWSGKSDGIYGPETAKRFARYGIVPPTPLYWPKASPSQAKTEYKRWLDAQSMTSATPNEWKVAAAAVK